MWALIQSLLKTKQSLYGLQRALDWTHNESLHSKQKNQKQKTWSKEERSFFPSSPQSTEKDRKTRCILPTVLHHSTSPIKGLCSFAGWAVFPVPLLNSENSLTQPSTRAQLHFGGIFITLTLGNTSMRAAQWSTTGESYVSLCQLRMAPEGPGSMLTPE